MVTQTHPQHARQLPTWQKVQDTFEGEDLIKSKTFEYLKPTHGMEVDGVRGVKGDNNVGWLDYKRYLDRANYPELMVDTVDALTGIMHRKPPVIEVPEKMKPMLDAMDVEGGSAAAFLRKINEAQLLFGRYGILVELPDGAGPSALPYLVGYKAMEITNWDKGIRSQGRFNPTMVTLDESGVELEDFSWTEKKKFRVLRLKNGVFTVELYDPSASESVPTRTITPTLGGKKFNKLPFVVVNSGDLSYDVGSVPLAALANLCLSIYRGEADYRQALHNQAQDTLVTIGLGDTEKDIRVGTGAHIDIEAVGGDAKFIGVDSKGLSEMRTAVENDRKAATGMGAKLLDPSEEGGQASGEALRIRVASQTASLSRIVKTGALALQDALRHCADIVGANRDEVTVEPNMDFAAGGMTGKELLDLVTSQIAGAPLSQRSIHALMTKGDLTTIPFEEEIADLPEVPGNDDI